MHRLFARKLSVMMMLLLGGTAASLATVVPSALFSDNAVLQATTIVPVWGWDNPGQQVTVTVGKAQATGTADKDGRWEVELPQMQAGDASLDMAIAGSSAVTVKNVLVGEVWLGSGQSNMAFPMRWGNTKVPEYTKAVSEANYPTFRMFHVEERWGGEPPPRDVVGKWEVCTPESVVGWSAAAFFFGRNLQQQLGGTPVGIIDSSAGGTQIVSWIPPKDYAQLFPKVTPRNQEEWAQSAKQMHDFYAQWDDTVAKATAAGTPVPPQPKITVRMWPGCLYDGMVAPLTPCAIRGVVWYQGESNTYVKDADGYAKMLQDLVTSWRTGWKQGDLPFLIVQLPNYSEDLSTGKRAAYAGLNTKVVQSDPVEENSQWAPIREVQRHTVAMLPNTALVVTIDIGEQLMVHPWNKWDLGQRCALAAMKLAYGKKDLVASGPLVDGAEFKDGKAIVKFTSVGGGLQAKDGGEIKGFALAGSDGKFAWAKAVVKGDTVVLSSDEVKDPASVRYSWAENPIGNLINKEGLPASPFATDGTVQGH